MDRKRSSPGNEKQKVVLEHSIYLFSVFFFYQDVLSGFISAYRPNYSCGTSLLTEDWRRSRDSKETVAIVSIDLSKAFGSIRYALWLAKLKAYGLSETSIELLKGATFPQEYNA